VLVQRARSPLCVARCSYRWRASPRTVRHHGDQRRAQRPSGIEDHTDSDKVALVKAFCGSSDSWWRAFRADWQRRAILQCG
jgi:hypothetical protein